MRWHEGRNAMRPSSRAPDRGSATGRGRRRRAAIAVAAAGLAVGVAACAPGPPQPAPPAPGSNAPCERTDVRLTNPDRPANPDLRGVPDRRGRHPEPRRDLRRRCPPGPLPRARVARQLQRPLRGHHRPLHPDREHRRDGDLRGRQPRRRPGLGRHRGRRAHRGDRAAARAGRPRQRRADRALARRRHAAVRHPAGRGAGLGHRGAVAVLAGPVPGDRLRADRACRPTPGPSSRPTTRTPS